MSTENSTERIVVGADGSPESSAALAWAARYARATGGTVRAVLAWHYPTAVGEAPVGVAPDSVTDPIKEEKLNELRQTIAGAFGPDAADVDLDVEYGHAAQVLIDASKDADLLIVGSRGHGAFQGMLLGSISMHCVTHAACPVAVIRAQQ